MTNEEARDELDLMIRNWRAENYIWKNRFLHINEMSGFMFSSFLGLFFVLGLLIGYSLPH